MLQSDAEQKLGTFAARWFNDRREVARGMLLEYVEDGCDRPHHRALVKRLFKLAEAADDDALMVRFMVAFDTMPRRELACGRAYDWETRDFYDREYLRTLPDLPRDGEGAKKAARFSVLTRQYLARRTWRWFRRIARTDPARYVAAVGEALVRYRDEDLDTPAKLLDAWCLFHALYWGSAVCLRNPRGILVHPEHALSELRPAPYQPDAWTGRFELVLDLLGRAQGRPW